MNARLAERAQQTTPSSAPVHFYASSGGNAGLAAVHAASALGHPCTVVVPHSTKPFMLAKLRASGARAVIQHGAVWQDADTYLRETVMARDAGAVYVPPFDHADIWAGHASIVAEMHAQWPCEAPAPAALICSVGGGGLLVGVVQGLQRASGWEAVTVLAMETAGAESLNASVRAGELVTLGGISSQATSLGATRVAARAYEVAVDGKVNVRSVVLSDAEAAMGVWRLADDERMLVELACGVNVALCYDGRLEKALGRKLASEDSVVVVVCGGSVVTLDMVARWREEFGEVERGVPEHRDVASDCTAPVLP